MEGFIVTGIGTNLSVLLAVVGFLLNVKQKAYDLMPVLGKSEILQFSSTKLVTRSF